MHICNVFFLELVVLDHIGCNDMFLADETFLYCVALMLNDGDFLFVVFQFALLRFSKMSLLLDLSSICCQSLHVSLFFFLVMLLVCEFFSQELFDLVMKFLLCLIDFHLVDLLVIDGCNFYRL